MEFGEHVFRGDFLRIVVLQALVPGNIGYRAQRGAANFASPFGNIVSHGEELVAVLVQEQMIVSEMPATHMPMEVFCLHIEGEHICQQLPQFLGDFRDGGIGESAGGHSRLIGGKGYPTGSHSFHWKLVDCDLVSLLL